MLARRTLQSGKISFNRAPSRTLLFASRPSRPLLTQYKPEPKFSSDNKLADFALGSCALVLGGLGVWAGTDMYNDLFKPSVNRWKDKTNHLIQETNTRFYFKKCLRSVLVDLGFNREQIDGITTLLAIFGKEKTDLNHDDLHQSKVEVAQWLKEWIESMQPTATSQNIYEALTKLQKETIAFAAIKINPKLSMVNFEATNIAYCKLVSTTLKQIYDPKYEIFYKKELAYQEEQTKIREQEMDEEEILKIKPKFK